MGIATLFIAIAGAMVASTASASPSYLFVDAKGDGSHAIFVDLNSLHRTGSKLDYWMLQVNLAATATKPHFVSHILRRYTEDCAANSGQMTYSVMYTASGELLSGGAISAPVVPVIPDSVGSEIEDLLCHGQPPSFELVTTVTQARALGRKLFRKSLQQNHSAK